MNWSNKKVPLWFERFIVCFSVIGAILGVATLAVVSWVMSKIRSDAREHVTATGDPERIAAFHQALHVEQLVSLGILALIVLVAALNIGAGVVMVRHDKKV